MGSIWQTDIRYLKGIGEAKARLFHRLEIETVGDLMTFFPRIYEDRSETKKIAELQVGDEVCVTGTVLGTMAEYKPRRGLSLQSIRISDGTGVIQAVWFNSPFLKDIFTAGSQFVFYGKVNEKSGRKQLSAPVYEKLENGMFTGRIVPIYPLTGGLNQKTVQKAIQTALDAGSEEIEEFLPLWIRKKYKLAEEKYAICNIHFPKDKEQYEIARRRLVFEELFLLQLGLASVKSRQKEQRGISFAGLDCVGEFISSLPYALTGAQSRVIGEIQADLKVKRPMSRLVQGDVGCGKTVVAAASIYMAYKNGFQSVMMAPTEILAKQHLETMTQLLAPFGVKMCLLTGSMAAKEKRAALQALKEGEVQLAIGTHALIQDGVEYKNLGLVITDEQHRFGVKQRTLLSQKGENPNVLVMTATPIPRTLGLIIYGDLDSSVIDELPPGRKKVDTYGVGEDMRERIYKFAEKEIKSGRQIYIVCPMVEEGETADLKAVTEYAESLRNEVFTDRRIGVVYGRMKSKEKDLVMEQFANREIDILVSTTVIEVGVNVPNASVMIIENAERFGLSALHQLRGRVGRGSDKAYCILLYSSISEVARKRIEIMSKTNDGFVIAEKDLEIRGPGEFFGTRQHGLPALKIADLFTDRDILAKAGEAARTLIKQDINLENPEHAKLKERLRLMFRDEFIFN